MTSSALLIPQLLKMEEPDFNTAIGDMSITNLIETITLIQKEMTREQENFTALGSELSGLKKTSGQYKSISKEMTASQARLTLLMDRSMKCFNQKMRNSENQTADKNKSEPVKPKSEPLPVNRLSTSDKPPSLKNSAGSRTMIKVQSLKTNNPVKVNKAEINGANNDDINRLSFDAKKDIVSHALPSMQDTTSCQPVLENVSQIAVSNSQQIKDISSQNSGATNGYASEPDLKATLVMSVTEDVKDNLADNKLTKDSAQAANLNGLQHEQPEVVKSSEKPSKPASKVVLNVDKQLIDLDSFTERKNMLSELKKFDKHLKSVPVKSDAVSEIKVAMNASKPDEDIKQEPHGFEVDVRSKSALFGEIKAVKKPSDNSVSSKTSKTNGPSSNSKTNSENDKNDQAKQFDSLLDDMDADSADLNKNPEKETQDDVNTDIEQNIVIIKDTDTGILEAHNPLMVQKIPASDEITAPQWRTIDTVKEESDDCVSQTSDMSTDDDRFVTEFSFPSVLSNIQAAPKAASLTEPNNVTNGDSNEVKSAVKVKPEVKIRVTGNEPNGSNEVTKNGPEAKGIVKVTGKQPDVKVTGKESEVKVTRNEPKVKVTGMEPEVNAAGEELVKDTRVKFRDWDPSKLLAKLYEVKMMPDNIEDISHKFIGMEGLMEKLPMNKKKATLLKTWKRRFFRAQDGWLHYYETSNRDKPSDSLQLMGGKVEELGPRVLGVDDGRGKYLMVRVPTDHEYGQWKIALESQTADNVKATYVRPSPASIPNPKKVIIIDIGTSGIRAGVLGERPTLPQVFFPSVVAIDKSTGKIIVGPHALKPEVRQSSNVINPIQPTNKVDKGQVLPFNIDMEVMQAIFHKVFSDLQINPTQFLVMLSTPQTLGEKMREAMMHILIDELRVRGACMVQQSLLALYSYNAMSGIIVDIGERLEILPIYEGVLIEGGVSRQAYGGTKIQDSLHISLLENRYKFSTPVEKLLVKYICEQACYVSGDYNQAKTECDGDPTPFRRQVDLTEFDLPEGAHSLVELDYACFKSPEGFFNTELWEMDYKNLQRQVFNAIQQCPMDSRKHMYRSVYLSGGVTMIPGFAERLQEELHKLAPPSVVVEVHASPQRYHAAYIGACSVASMDIFEMSCVSTEEWRKHGVKACSKWGTN
ncbi:uncharacterized protein LOC127880612 isoform X2 [Dreissena polymorpha]|uniref:uncharacterized protein LOC127880612 isoform X2 n=1 Tax=Dreissena polymorpha TaxID=45954 RepID=UPI002263EAD2|nr:uncharacterized protein LOC127880612 isoform X2 [Dreissena polymorpha]